MNKSSGGQANTKDELIVCDWVRILCEESQIPEIFLHLIHGLELWGMVFSKQ